MKFLRRVFIIITYLTFLGAAIGLGVVAFLQNRDTREALETYEAIQSNLDQESSTNSIVNALEDLQNDVAELQTSRNTAQEELDLLKSTNEGYGEISGEILPFISNESSINQYQRVCAVLVDNSNQQYCVTTSAIEKGFTLLVPAGNYNVFAEIVLEEVSELTQTRAYYTEFVTCSADESERNCSESLRENRIEVEVGVSDTIENVDPIDWVF